ncbi:MAG TPA: M64 family metallopeptidase [Allosphingosinicella sp.]|nr:M64 family metallopeptidase [Allosphingosinicella sp.]
MAGQLVSLRGMDWHAPARVRGLAAEEAAAGSALPPGTGVWRDENGEIVGDPVEIGEPETIHLEYPGEDGRFGWSEVTVPPVISAEIHTRAASLAIATTRGVAELPVAGLALSPSALPPPQTDTVGPEGAAFLFPVISERFEHWEDFIAKVRDLRGWIVGKPPFNEAAVGERLALKALFWPSDPINGLFGTDDGQSQNGRLFYGDRVLAKQLIDPWIDPGRPSLVLINSNVRGGAGGVPGYSAWTSVRAAPLEPWQAVGLHEIGHALGLADEYLDNQRVGEFKPDLEPNVTREARADQTPWAAKITVPGDAAPSHPALLPGGPHPGVIGTFRGARYRPDHYRPMAHCLMRETGADFCTICQDHIRAVI